MTDARILELAEEAAACIEVNDLTYEEMFSYLREFLVEVVDEIAGVPKKKPKKGPKRARRTPR